jgi:hypothetical protein
LSEENAAAFAGVSVDSVARWKSKDESFADSVKQAKAEAIGWYALKLREAAGIAARKGNATPMIYYLRTHATEFRQTLGDAATDSELGELFQVAHAAMVSLAGAGRTTSRDHAVSHGAEAVQNGSRREAIV